MPSPPPSPLYRVLIHMGEYRRTFAGNPPDEVLYRFLRSYGLEQEAPGSPWWRGTWEAVKWVGSTAAVKVEPVE